MHQVDMQKGRRLAVSRNISDFGPDTVSVLMLQGSGFGHSETSPMESGRVRGGESERSERERRARDKRLHLPLGLHAAMHLAMLVGVVKSVLHGASKHLQVMQKRLRFRPGHSERPGSGFRVQGSGLRVDG